MNNKDNITFKIWKETFHSLDKSIDEFKRNDFFFLKINIVIIFFILSYFLYSINTEEAKQLFNLFSQLVSNISQINIVDTNIMSNSKIFMIFCIIGSISTLYWIIKSNFIQYDINDRYELILNIENDMEYKPITFLKSKKDSRKYNYKYNSNYNCPYYLLTFYIIVFEFFFELKPFILPTLIIFIIWYIRTPLINLAKYYIKRLYLFCVTRHKN